MIFISVLTYNRKETIITAIESILSQGIQNQFHVIIVDDGSIDGTWDLLRSNFASQLQSGVFTYIFHENHGINYSRFIALECAKKLSKDPKNDFFTFCDSDDHLLSSALENICNTINTYKDHAIYAFPWKDQNGANISSIKENGWFSYEEIYQRKLMQWPDFQMVVCLGFLDSDIQFQKDLRWWDGYFYEELIVKYWLVLVDIYTYVATINRESMTRSRQTITAIADLYESERRRQKYLVSGPRWLLSISYFRLAMYSGILNRKSKSISYIFQWLQLGLHSNFIPLLHAIIALLPGSLWIYNFGNFLYQKIRNF